MLPVFALVVVLAIVLAFSGALRNGLVNWDDQQLLLENKKYHGLDSEALGWMFTTALGGHYQPLTWLSFAVDFFIWGRVEPIGIHLTNILLHAATAVMFLFVVARLLRSPGVGLDSQAIGIGALVAALLFAVHPLRVESVAWATERRDVLGGAWIILSLWLYLCGTDASSARRRKLWIAASLAAYFLSLFSKASGVVLPVVLLLLDRYPLRRSTRSAEGRAERPIMHPKTPSPHPLPLPGRGVLERTRSIVLEKLCYVVPAVVFAGLALWAQSQAGALWSLEAHPLSMRIAGAFYGIMFYLTKTVWPTDLSPLYEHDPQATPFEPIFILCAAAVTGITLAAWLTRGRWPWFGVSWAMYIVILLPVLGLAQSGPQLVADRYSYLSGMPWAVLVGAGAARAWGRSGSRRSLQLAMVAAVLSLTTCLVWMSKAQTTIWKNSYTLWMYVVERSPDAGLGHANLAVVLAGQSEYERARAHGLKALERLPGNRSAHATMGLISMELGNLPAAEHHLRTAIQIAADLGQRDLLSLYRLGIVFDRMGRDEEAEQVFRDLIEVEPDNGNWLYALASFLASRDRLKESGDYFEKVVQSPTRPRDAEFRYGSILKEMGYVQRALDIWTDDLRADPANDGLRIAIAWTLATTTDNRIRDGKRSLELLASIESNNEFTRVKLREAMAAALAEIGDFDAAVATVEQGIGEYSRTAGPRARAGPDPLLQRMHQGRERYLRGEPMRE